MGMWVGVKRMDKAVSKRRHDDDCVAAPVCVWGGGGVKAHVLLRTPFCVRCDTPLSTQGSTQAKRVARG
jgi:hypothetical protein